MDKIDDKVGTDGFAGDLGQDEAALVARAKAGDAEAAFTLGRIYHQGEGVEKNGPRAVAWMRKASSLGLAKASHTLSEWYGQGDGVTKNPAKSAQMREEAIRQGDREALFDRTLTDLLSVEEKRVREGVAAVFELAGKGVPRAVALARRFKVNGVEEGSADRELLHRLYLSGAEAGIAEMQVAVGESFRTGEGIDAPAPGKAVEWYRKAADQENFDGIFKLGYCYSEGLGIGLDSLKAIECWSYLAERNDVDSMVNIAELYRLGREDLKADLKKSIRWYRKAAKLGDSEAIYYLGLAYLNGTCGVKANRKRGRCFLTRSALGGFAPAMEMAEKVGMVYGDDFFDPFLDGC